MFTLKCLFLFKRMTKICHTKILQPFIHLKVKVKKKLSESNPSSAPDDFLVLN